MDWLIDLNEVRSYRWLLKESTCHADRCKSYGSFIGINRHRRNKTIAHATDLSWSHTIIVIYCMNTISNNNNTTENSNCNRNESKARNSS